MNGRAIVLGGGVAGTSAAVELARQDVSVEILQMGWRLGGKGASGRNQKHRHRIEEHGLHVWFGFYRNAFDSLRLSYERASEMDRTRIKDVCGARSGKKLQPYPPFTETALPSISHGFVGSALIGVTEQHHDRFEPWLVNFPVHPGHPWEVDATRSPQSPFDLARSGLKFARRYLESIGVAGPDPSNIERWVSARSADEDGKSHAGRVLADAARLLDGGEPSVLWLYVAHEVVETLSTDVFGRDTLAQSVMSRLLAGAQRAMRSSINDAIAAEDGSTRRAWQMVDLMSAIVRGLFVDGVVTASRRLEDLDEEDFRDWLDRHGASELARSSDVIRAVVYDLAFGYRDGDANQPKVGAGTALRGLGYMFFDFDGHLMYKMRGAMGDVVFVPQFLELTHRHVAQTDRGCSPNWPSTLQRFLPSRTDWASSFQRFLPSRTVQANPIRFFRRVERFGGSDESGLPARGDDPPRITWLLVQRQRGDSGASYNSPLLLVDDVGSSGKESVLSWPSRPFEEQSTRSIEQLLSDEELRWAYETSRGSLASATLWACADRIERMSLRTDVASPWNSKHPRTEPHPTHRGLWPSIQTPKGANQHVDRSEKMDADVTSWGDGTNLLLDDSVHLVECLSLELWTLTNDPSEGDRRWTFIEPIAAKSDNGQVTYDALTFTDATNQIARRSLGALYDGDKDAETKTEAEAIRSDVRSRLNERHLLASKAREQFPTAVAPKLVIGNLRNADGLRKWTLVELDVWRGASMGVAPALFTREAEDKDSVGASPQFVGSRLREICNAVSDHIEQIRDAQRELQTQAMTLARVESQRLPPWDLSVPVKDGEKPAKLIATDKRRLITAWLKVAKDENDNKVDQKWKNLVERIYLAVRPISLVAISIEGSGRLLFAVRSSPGALGLLQPIATIHPADLDKPVDLEVLKIVPEGTEPPRILHVSVTRECREDSVVVNAMPISVLPRVASGLLHRFPAWAASTSRVQTVATQGLQIWHQRSTQQLGWEAIAADAVHHRPSGSESAGSTVGGFVEPFDTWADLTLTEELEQSDQSCRVGLVSYFCNVLPKAQLEQVRGPWGGTHLVLQNALRFLDRNAKELWPNAGDRYPDAFDWENEFRCRNCCIKEEAQKPAARDCQACREFVWPANIRALLRPQRSDGGDSIIRAEKERAWKVKRQQELDTLAARLFVTANIDEANAYVLTVPGSTKFRLWPGDTGVANLTFAGDWTRSILDAGCVEAAVVSGKLAAESSLIQLGLEDRAPILRKALSGMDGRSWPTARSRK